MTTKNRFNCTWKIWKQDSINLLHHLSILDLVELFLHFLNILKPMSRLELCVRFFFSHWDWQSPSKKCELARWSEVKFFDLKERASSLRLDRWQTLATSYCCFLLLFFSVLKKKHSNKNTHEQTPYMTCLERWKNNFTHLCDFHVQVNKKPVTCILYKQQCQINKNSKNTKETVAIIKIN